MTGNKKSAGLVLGLVFGLGLGLALLPMVAVAGDLGSAVRKGAGSPSDADGNYLEVGVNANLSTNPVYGVPEGNTDNKIMGEIASDVNWRAQHKHWFVEVFSQGINSLTLGYNFFSTDTWSLDMIGINQHGELNGKYFKDLKGYKARHADFMTGPRAMAYFDNYILQLTALTDASNAHNGQIYSANIARFWQQKNWNFHAILGASYHSRKVMDYYLTVTPDDATEKFMAFEAEAGYMGIVEIGVTYPISQKWVFRGFLRHVELDHQWTGSSIIMSDHGDVLSTSISYVF
jgi:MipA family protein